MGNSIDHSFVIIKEGLKYFIFFFILFGITLYLSYITLALLSFIMLLGVCLVFYNPERKPNEKGNNVILAPIDGIIKKIEHEGQQVSLTISSPPCFVGIIRLPFGGVMSLSRTQGFCFGRFYSVLDRINECAEMILESTYGKIICTYYPLFSPKNLRFFIPFFPLQKGERIGFMPYGVLKITITSHVRLKVCEGDRIKGGQTTLGIFNT